MKELRSDLSQNMFKCYATGKCCHERYGYETFILPTDAYALSKKLDLDLRDFFDQFCNVVAYKWITGQRVKFSVLKRKKTACIFLKENKCAVHPYKPFVCKAGPIIPPLFDGHEFDSWFKTNCRGANEANKKDLSLIYNRNKKELERRFHKYYEEYFKKEPTVFWIILVKSISATSNFKGV